MQKKMLNFQKSVKMFSSLQSKSALGALSKRKALFQRGQDRYELFERDANGHFS